jgi:hypothetical protein
MSLYARESFLNRKLSGVLNASLNGIPMRLNPTSVELSYQVKTSEIPTLGGMVVQVFGVEMSDLVVTGTFGRGGYGEQAEFLNRMLAIAGYQANQSFSNAGGPVRFVYPNRGFDFMVYLKDFTSTAGMAIDYENVNIAPDWQLTLFVDVDNTGGSLTKVAANAFIQRLSNGLGYQLGKYNGNLTTADIENFLASQGYANNPQGYLKVAFGDPRQQAAATAPTSTDGTSAPGTPASGGSGQGQYSGAKWMPVGNHGGAMSAHVGLLLHVCQGDNSQYSHFNTPGAGAVSAHFWVAKTGAVEQYVDGNNQAWHAAAANDTYLGVETEGMNTDPLTDAQVKAVAGIYKWAVASYGLPVRLSTKPGDAGFGWHGEGGSDWGGHIYCPGDLRRAQMPAILKLVSG